jgi:hypothetical protein
VTIHVEPCHVGCNGCTRCGSFCTFAGLNDEGKRPGE